MILTRLKGVHSDSARQQAIRKHRMNRKSLWPGVIMLSMAVTVCRGGGGARDEKKKLIVDKQKIFARGVFLGGVLGGFSAGYARGRGALGGGSFSLTPL